MYKKIFISLFFGFGLLMWQVVFVSAATTSVLAPSSDGNYSQWTPSTGSTHYSLVDETPCNGTTDYNFTTTVGNRDSYVVNISSVPNGATLTQVEIKPCAARNSNGQADPEMDVFYRLNGSNSSDIGDYALTGTTPVELATTTFSAISVVKGPATTFEIGGVLASGTKGARLSRIATQLTYTPLSAPTNATSLASKIALSVQINWTDNSSNESNFVIERGLDGINFSGLATTSANTITYNDSGLSSGSTYYYRIRAFNSGAYSAYTNITSATTMFAPTVTTINVSNLTASTTRLKGSANPNGGSTTGWFRYSTSDPGSCNDAFGTRLPASDGISLGYGTSTLNVSKVAIGLTASTTYYYCSISHNAAGTSTGSVLSFTTRPTANSISLVRSSNQYLSGPHDEALDITEDLTMETWFNPSSFALGGTNGLMNFGSYQLMIGAVNASATAKILATMGGSATQEGTTKETSDIQFAFGQWYHVAGVYRASAGEMDIYINGSFLETLTGFPTSLPIRTDTLWCVGSLGGVCTSGDAWDGKLDEVRIWSMARTAQEIAENYNVELNGDETDLEGYWDFDGNSYLDRTSNDIDLTPANSPSFSTDGFPYPFPNSISLVRSSNQYLSGPHDEALDITEDLTMETWFNPSSFALGGTNGLMNFGSYQLMIGAVNASGTAKILATMGGSATQEGTTKETSDIQFAFGQWYHVAGVYRASAGEMDIYINGSFLETLTGFPTSLPIRTDTLWCVGSLGGVCTSGDAWDGKLDEVRIWSVARTALEIAGNFNTELVGDETGLEGYWDFDGNSYLDRTSNDIDLTPGNSPSFTEDTPF